MNVYSTAHDADVAARSVTSVATVPPLCNVLLMVFKIHFIFWLSVQVKWLASGILPLDCVGKFAWILRNGLPPNSGSWVLAR